MEDLSPNQILIMMRCLDFEFSLGEMTGITCIVNISTGT